MGVFYITWAPWKSWMLPLNMGQLTSSRSPHAGDLLSQSHKSCGDVHSPPPPASPAPCPQEQWGWAAKAPGWEVMASHWAARFGGRSHGLYCTEPKAGLLLPPAILAGNLGISARGASEGFPLQKLTFHSLFFFLLSSFIFFFFSTQKGTGSYGKLTALVYGSCMWEPVSVCTQGQCWILQQLLLSLEPKLPYSLRYLLIL